MLFHAINGIFLLTIDCWRLRVSSQHIMDALSKGTNCEKYYRSGGKVASQPPTEVVLHAKDRLHIWDVILLLENLAGKHADHRVQLQIDSIHVRRSQAKHPYFSVACTHGNLRKIHCFQTTYLPAIVRIPPRYIRQILKAILVRSRCKHLSAILQFRQGVIPKSNGVLPNIDFCRRCIVQNTTSFWRYRGRRK